MKSNCVSITPKWENNLTESEKENITRSGDDFSSPENTDSMIGSESEAICNQLDLVETLKKQFPGKKNSKHRNSLLHHLKTPPCPELSKKVSEEVTRFKSEKSFNR